MSENSKVILPLIKLKNGYPMVLFPKAQSQGLSNLLDNSNIGGGYGHEIDSLGINHIKNEFYKRVDDDVALWISEKTLIPRFATAALIFVVSFLSLSLLIRDALPFLDEFLVSFAAAALYFILSRKRRVASLEASERRLVLREKVDSIAFDMDPTLRRLDEALWDWEESGFIEYERVSALVDQMDNIEQLYQSCQTLGYTVSGKRKKQAKKLARKELLRISYKGVGESKYKENAAEHFVFLLLCCIRCAEHSEKTTS